MNRRRSAMRFCLAGSLAALLTAGQAIAQPAPPAPPAATVARYAYGVGIRSLDPATCNDTPSLSLQANIYEGLYAYHYLKRPAVIVGVLAEGMPKISPDGRTYTIRIKRGIKYQPNACFAGDDGDPNATREVRAEDFVLAIKRAADAHVPAGLSWAFLDGRIAGLNDFRAMTREADVKDYSRYDVPVPGLRAIDEQTLQIRLRGRYPQFLNVLALHVYAPIPAELIDRYFKKRLQPNPTIRHPREVVGTGPYLLSRFRYRGPIVLSRNPGFREERYPTEGAPGDAKAGLLQDAGKKLPFIDKIVYRWQSDSRIVWREFLANRIDAVTVPADLLSDVATPDGKLTKAYADRQMVLEAARLPSLNWLAFNMADPVLGKSKSLRQALCLGLDVEKHVQRSYSGLGMRALSILPSTIAGHVEAGSSPHAQYDPMAARVKLRQARAELVRAGVLRGLNSPLPKLTVQMGGNDAASRRTGRFIADQFANLGLRVVPVYNDWPTLLKKVRAGKAQIFTMGWHADYPDAQNFLQMFYSRNIAEGINNFRYVNPAFDKLYERAGDLPAGPERMKLYVQMVRIVNEDCPMLLLDEATLIRLRHPWLRNVKPRVVGYGYLKYHRIDPALRAKITGSP